MKNILAFVVASIVVCAAGAASAAPNTVGFSGVLTTASGGLVDDPVEITFSFLPEEDAPTASAVRTEIHSAVEVDRGFTFVALGQAGGSGTGITVVGSSLAGALSDGGVVWIEVKVGNDVLEPRIPIHSVPYALQAADVNCTGCVNDGEVGSINASKLTAGTVAVERLPVGTSANSVAAGNHTHPSPIRYESFFLQFGIGGEVRLNDYTASNAACFVGRIDVFNIPAKCQAYLQGSQWVGYTEGQVFCNIICMRW